MSDAARDKVEADPAKALEKMLSKMDDEDKEAFNWWHRQAKAHGAREAMEQVERSSQYATALLCDPCAEQTAALRGLLADALPIVRDWQSQTGDYNKTSTWLIRARALLDSGQS